MGRTQKAGSLKVSAVSSLTPQPIAASKRQKDKALKSEPPAKRKKLAQELDEELSDSEFDAQLVRMRTEEKQLKGKKFDDVKHGSDDDGEGEDDEEESEDADSDDDDVDSDDQSEGTEDDDDDDVDSDDEIIGSNDDSSDADDDNSDLEHEDVKKSVTKSKGKKSRSDSKKKQKKAEEIIPIEATEMAQDLIAKASMDKRTLFLKNLPSSVTTDDIRSLCSDVLRVRLQSCKAKNSRKLKCAFVEFCDEKTAVKSKANFENKKIGENTISVDFVGEKSSFRPKMPQFPTSVDPKKLYISGLGKDATVEDLKKLFPTASSIDFPHYKKENCSKGYAFIHYTDEKACKDAHAAMQNQVISGRVLTVMYGKKFQPETKESKKNKQSSRQARKNKKTVDDSIEDKENGTESDSDDKDSSENAEDSSENAEDSSENAEDSSENVEDSSENDSN